MLKILGTQQRPDKISEHEGGGGAAQDEIEHGSNLPAKCDETHQRGEDRHGVDNRNDIAHCETSVREQARRVRRTCIKMPFRNRRRCIKTALNLNGHFACFSEKKRCSLSKREAEAVYSAG
jgi:hypothetical protein